MIPIEYSYSPVTNARSSVERKSCEAYIVNRNLHQAARRPASVTAFTPLDELGPSLAARQYSRSVPSAQPRFPGKMVYSVWGGAYPRRL